MSSCEVGRAFLEVLSFVLIFACDGCCIVDFSIVVFGCSPCWKLRNASPSSIESNIESRSMSPTDAEPLSRKFSEDADECESAAASIAGLLLCKECVFLCFVAVFFRPRAFFFISVVLDVIAVTVLSLKIVTVLSLKFSEVVGSEAERGLWNGGVFLDPFSCAFSELSSFCIERSFSARILSFSILALFFDSNEGRGILSLRSFNSKSFTCDSRPTT